VLKESQASLAELRRIAEESKHKSKDIKFMQMLSHTDVQNVCWLFDYAEKATKDVVDMNYKLALGISSAISAASSGANRQEIISLLKSVLKDCGYEAVD